MVKARYPDFWGVSGGLARLLLPLSGLYCGLVAARRGAYRLGLRRPEWPTAPVVVVGNLTVGGTGKTPLVVWLAREAQALGYAPGVILRGHGGRARGPTRVSAASDPACVGDEAVLIARRTGVPVVIGRHRAAAAQALLADHQVDLLISDDGLQHLRLGRDAEVVVVDARRGLGNRYCLPAGPLREPASRLRRADLVISNGGPWPGATGSFALVAEDLRAVQTDTRPPPKPGTTVHGVAGIGHPERFFATLAGMGFEVCPHAFPDHHVYQREDLAFTPPAPVIMTEKDAVKCRDIAPPNSWYVPVRAQPDAATAAQLKTLLQALPDRAKRRFRHV